MSSEDSTVVRSIVLIDDDADFLHVLKRRLQAERAEFATAGPLEIHTYSDPIEALVNLPAEPICVAIIDYNMPGCTGVDWLPKLVGAGVGPVILLTNQTGAKTAVEAFHAGAADYLVKSDVVADDPRLGKAVREAVHRYRLEARNRTLTRELKLLNAELESKNKHLHELTETAHRFVDDVAHDLRTPLTVIGQYASIITDGLGGPVTDRQRDHLSVISTASREMSEMVDDFLDSSKLKTKTLSVDRERHSAQELFESVTPMLTVRAEPKHISIDVSGVQEATFFADLSKAARVLTNLAVNAIKVTSAGRPLQLWSRKIESGDVQIGVTDQGPGLRPEDLNVIFERFKQLEEPQTAGTKGFGLGLSIAKQLAWLNLGRIEVQSEFGKGSTFSFTLPGNQLERILTNYIESARLMDKIGDLRMLCIRPQGEEDITTLRRLVSSSCYAMDLVLEDSEQKVINTIGVCSKPETWMTRIRESIARFYQSVGKQPIEVEITVRGGWMLDGDTAELQKGLLETIHSKHAYA
jgi:signal transduction histidine kinase